MGVYRWGGGVGGGNFLSPPPAPQFFFYVGVWPVMCLVRVVRS